MGCARPLVGNPLREQGHDVGAFRTQRLVEERGNAAIRERPGGGAPGLGLLEGALDVLDRVSELYGGSVDEGVDSRIRDEIGQLGYRQVHFHHSAATLPSLDVGHEVAGELPAIEEVQEGSL